MEGGVNMPGLGGLYGEEPPEGWGRSSSEPYTFIDDFIFQCGRVSWGSLERPSFVLWEVHESFSAPESCQEEGRDNRFIATAWFSDAGLFEQAKQLGMPAFFGTFALDISEVAGARTWEWRWNAEGQDESTLVFHDNPAAGSDEFPTYFRFFWFTETTVNYIDLDYTITSNRATDFMAAGTMAAPMLYAEGGNPVYAGVGNPAFNGSFSATLHQFGDLQCKQPLVP